MKFLLAAILGLFTLSNALAFVFGDDLDVLDCDVVGDTEGRDV